MAKQTENITSRLRDLKNCIKRIFIIVIIAVLFPPSAIAMTSSQQTKIESLREAIRSSPIDYSNTINFKKARFYFSSKNRYTQVCDIGDPIVSESVGRDKKFLNSLYGINCLQLFDDPIATISGHKIYILQIKGGGVSGIMGMSILEKTQEGNYKFLTSIEVSHMHVIQVTSTSIDVFGRDYSIPGDMSTQDFIYRFTYKNNLPRITKIIDHKFM